MSKYLVDTLNSLGFLSSNKEAGPDLPIGIVGHWPRAPGIWGPTETNLSRKNDPVMSLALQRDTEI